MLADPCADPGILPGASRPDCQKTALTFFLSFLSSTFTVLQWLINGLFQRNYNFTRFRGWERVSNIFQEGPTFSRGGGQTFSRGGGGSKY